VRNTKTKYLENNIGYQNI